MQRQVSLVVAVALVGAAVLAGAAGAALAQEETPTPGDNETDGEASTPIDQHADPRNVSEDGDLGQLSDWLSGHLSERLEGGMIELSQGQYDQVEGLVGDDFESRFSQFVDVAGETNAESDDEAAEAIESVAEEQREFSDDVERYRETYEAYREAREQGSADAARDHARDLEDLAGDIENAGGDLRSGYERIGNTTGQDLSDGMDAVDTVLTNVSTTQEEVREVTFVETELSVTANRSVAAFDQPVRIEGQVVAANGSALANRSITIEVGERSNTVTTDGEGRFTTVYRPIWLRTDVESVPVTFRPQPESAFLDSRANVSLRIEPVEPTVSIAETPESVAFGGTVPVAATVTVDGRPVPGVSGSVEVDQQTLSRSNASADGVLSLDPPLPATVQAGERTVRVGVGEEGRAISPGAATSSIQVETTATNLSIATEQVDGEVVVTGTLSTTGGEGVANRSIFVEAGSTSETTATNESGVYRATLDGESLAEPGSEVSVSSTFSGEGTNLEGASATTAVTVPGSTGESAGSGSFLTDVPWLVVGVAVSALAILAGVIFIYLRRDRSGGEPATPEEPTEPVDEPVTDVDDADRWIDAAREALASGDERGAISRAYAASYARVQTQLGVGDDRTPRELVAAAEGRVDDSMLEALATVTDAYERMAFAESAPSGARDVLAAARVIVDGRGRDTTSDDD